MAGVRIVPPVVEFFDAESDVVHQMALTVQNMSKTSKTIRFHGPASNLFRLKVKNPDHAIAPGLEVAALVEYYTTKAEDAQDRVILVADNDVVEIPLIAYTPSPQLELSGPADFGVSVADGKVLSQEIYVINEGSLSGEFKIRYSGDQPVTIMPSGGVVKPGTKQAVKLEFISKTPGELNEIAHVKLEGQLPTTLQIIGNVVERSLELLTLDTQETVRTINFGSTYYGTDLTKSFMIFNNGPDEANFVVVLEEGGEGQEVGIDLTKNATAMLLSQTQSQEMGLANDLTTLVTALPSQGVLHPLEQREIHFRFSPRYTKSNKGWTRTDQPPPRKDYTLFMHIETVGSVAGISDLAAKSNGGSRVEVALLGTALPVLLSISPSPVFKFGDCPVGKQIDALCTVNNESAGLPVAFSLHSTAHFHSSPSQDHISPGQSVDVLLSFRPNQMGTFKPMVPLEVMGSVTDDFSSDGDPTAVKLVPIYTTLIHLHGTGTRETNQQKTQPPPGTLQVAHPNDRATSIRPAKRNENIKTLFTGIERYTFVDPDYAYTDKEEQQRFQHKQQYLDYIKRLGEKRLLHEKKSEFHELNNALDLGMKSNRGLKPPKISALEISRSSEEAPFTVSNEVKLLSSLTLEGNKSQTLSKPLSDGLNAIPMTEKEKRDCSSVLSPQQLKLVDIGPSLMDFGQVCLRSVSTKDLMIVNNLDIYIHVVVQIDCRELRQTSPLSQVIPPNSVAKLAMMFESNIRGTFERSVNYSINGYHRQHIVVMAEVVSVALELSGNEVVLTPSPGLLADSGLRGSITLLNERNFPAEFSWSPVVDEKGTAFSIRPSSGSVDAFTGLECEVVYQPTFSAPDETDFLLHVTGGSDLKLKCLAKLGSAHCGFVERRLLLGSVPLHLTTVRTVSLKSTGHNHAYFEVNDTRPIPGMMISPKEGVVPVGGTAELKVEFTPNSIHKFDTHIEVNVRCSKTISLRVGGTIEPPCVDIDVNSFQFGGVHCGALATVKFKLQNMTRTEADMVFDLSRFLDFSLKFLDSDLEDVPVDDGAGVYHVSLKGQQVMECALEFQPSEVASYDFVIPVRINHTVAPTPAPSTFPPTPAPSHMNWTISELMTPAPSLVDVATPSRRVLATALRPPLQLSHSILEFRLPSGYFELGIESGAGRAQGCLFVNNSDQTLSWTLHTKAAGPLLEDGTFKFLHRTGSPFTPSSAGSRKSVIPDITLDSGETFQLGVLFTPRCPGLFVAHVPVILNGNRDSPYRTLTLKGELLAPNLRFDPACLKLMPVPLGTPVSVDFNIIARGYRRSSVLDYEIPQVELEDGSLQSVLEVSFPEGQSIQSCCTFEDEGEPCVIPCTATFQCSSPVSFTTAIVFTDGKEKYELPVTATADNCLLSCYPFLAAHQTDFHIICKQDGVSIVDKETDTQYLPPGEPVFMPCVTPNRPPTIASTSATSTSFGISTSTYPESSNEATSSTYRSTPHHGDTQPGGPARVASGGSDGNGTFTMDPGGESDERKFIRKVISAVQRYFSSQGWSGGPYPITIPKSLRSALQDTGDTQTGGTGAPRTSNWDSNTKRETRSLFDLVGHLCGRPVPGIPLASTLPSCPVDRVRQIHWMYCTLLTFLRGQGAMMSHVKPEDLLDAEDFRLWKKIQSKFQGSEVEEQVSSEDSFIEMKKETLFEAVSAHAWTHILSQLVKVLILSRITPHQYKKIQIPNKSAPLPEVNPDPLTSNVYGVGERILLAWINHHYNLQRNGSWPGAIGGSNPPCRWIVNFDVDFMDGLVLASLVGAHVPFVISTHLYSMYTRPFKAEQCLHNVVKVVDALRNIGVDYDLQPTDLTEPNPITILLLCIHLYQRLPHYLPRATVSFEGPLHDTVTRHVRLQNPSTKPLVYQVLLAGKDSGDFRLPMGETIQVPSKGHLQMPVEFKSRFLRPCSATLVLVGKREGTPCGNTLVFTLDTCITNIVPVATIKSESCCYELQKVNFDVTNPFPLTGEFRIVLVEARSSFPAASPAKAKVSKSNKNLKKVESRTDHGQTTKSPRKEFPPKVEQHKTESVTGPPDPMLSAFWSPAKTINMKANSTGVVEIHFLPFDVGHRQCSVLFINDKIGEFLYCIEANATLPLPSPMPVTDSPHSVRISSAAAARSGRGAYGGDERVVYWKCEHDESFTEDLCIPIVNEARENALAIAAQQRMSERELQRRKLTGTLTSCSVTASVAALGLGGDTFHHAGDPCKKEAFEKEVTEFHTELSSKFFLAASKVTIPASISNNNGRNSPKKTISLPVTFQPKGPGHYPCTITLKSAHDIRVYQLECTVTPEGSALELEFTSPAHQSVSQDIPVVNQSNHDWHLAATITGEGFYGPPVMVAKSRLTTHYPLMFRPSYEGSVEGKLTLTNTLDGNEQVYRLRGTGQKPLPLDHILIECPAKESATYTLQVPNVTKDKLTFQVKTDLDIVSGPATITVLPGKTAEHVITVSPWRRGTFSGIVSFDSPVEASVSPHLPRTVDDDEVEENDQNEIAENKGSAVSTTTRPYRLWYTIEIQASAPHPERTLEVTCAAHSAVAVDIAVTNPTRERIVMDVLIDGEALTGEPTIILFPRQQVTYHVTFAPTVIGEYTGSVIFQSEAVGEFWYDLILKATTPLPVHLPTVHSELGKSTYQMIRLQNPTGESLVLTPHCTNPANFNLELDNSPQILLAAGSLLEVPLKFTPSAIGRLHAAEISFQCPQLGSWVFHASGTGMMPGAADPINLYSQLGGNSSVIIPFKNPTDRQVTVDVIMKERLLSRTGALFSMRLDSQPKASVFCLLLKRAKSIPLEPGASLDIPISFAPDTMQLYEATVTVTIHREDPTDTWSGDYPSMMSTRMVNDLHWIYPVRGIPESLPIKESQAPCIECKARSRVEERVEVSLTGLAPNSVGAGIGRYPSVTPISLLGRRMPGELEYGVDYLNVPEEFRYELVYEDAESQSCLERSLGVSLMRKMKNQVSGVVILVFNFVFSPFKPFSHKTQLVISATSGGVWRFPLKLLATEPEVDDIITIESVGLNKDSVVGFRMTSQMRQPLPFEAFFAPSSDEEFTVTPSSGELSPAGTEGTLIKVAYKPQIYGKTHKAKLVVQTSDMQWTYDVIGTTADYNPPNARAKILSTSASSSRRAVKQKKNYVLENLKLQSTAVSSPLKGVRLVTRSAR